MPVNLVAPKPEDLLRVKGVELGIAEAGVRKAGRKDLLVMRLADGAKILVNPPGAAPVSALAWRGDGQVLAFGSEDGQAGLLAL